MTFGHPKPTLKDIKPGEPVPLIPPTCNIEIYSILEQIFEPNAETKEVDIQNILENPFFSSISTYSSPNIEMVCFLKIFNCKI